MAIYLTQRGGDETRVDEIEGKLKSTIPDLKRVPSVEAIDPKAVNGAERSIVILAAASRMGPNVDELIDAVRRSPRNLFFIVVGGDISASDYKRLIQSGNADWVAEVGLPHEIRDIVERVSAPARDDCRGRFSNCGFVHAERGRRGQFHSRDRNCHPSGESQVKQRRQGRARRS